MIFRLPSTFRRVSILLAISILLLLAAGLALADSCSGDCEGTDCTGGCTISHPSCGVGCISDGCPGRAICKTIGETAGGLSCTTELTAECKQAQQLPPQPEEQPSGLRVAPAAEWAVFSYRTDTFTPLGVGEVEMLAASDALYATVARDALVTRNRAEATRVRQRMIEEGLRVDGPAQRHLHYAVSPTGSCLGVGLEVGEQQLPGAEEASLFLRATVDARGRVVATEVLHSLAHGTEGRMVRFLKENTRLWRKDGAESPFEVFVVLSTMADGSVGWIVAGAKALL